MKCKTPDELMRHLEDRIRNETRAHWLYEAKEIIETILDAGHAMRLPPNEQITLVERFANRKRREDTIATMLAHELLPTKARTLLEELPQLKVAERYAKLWAVEDCIAQA